jgi:tRNA(fMet)-specific endonuclease VapC
LFVWAKNIANRYGLEEEKQNVLILDTLTIVQRKAGEEYDRLASRLAAAPPQPVYVTIVSFEEQARGWLAYSAAAKTLAQHIKAYARLRALLEDFQTRPILDFDEHAAAEVQRLTKRKIRIGTMDLRIAAIALVHNAVLLSRNLVDFRKVPGLRAEDWAS